MAINKVIYGGSTLIDLTGDDVTASDVLAGKIFHLANGDQSVGTKEFLTASVVDENLIVTNGDSATLGTKSITSNGTYDANDDNLDGYSEVTVNINPSLQSKTVTPTTSSQTVTADSGYALSQVIVNPIPSQYIVPSGSLNITENGTVDVIDYANAVVNVAGSSATVGTATATPSSNSTSISFSVQGEPKMFAIQINKNASYISGSSSRYITSVISNGSTVYTTCLYKSGSTSREYNYSTSSFSYSNGTLTITSAGSSTAGYFMSGTSYRLIYVY